MKSTRTQPLQSVANACAGALLLTSASLASAQSAVSIYGILDASLRHERAGAVSQTSLTSGLSRGSRLGFKSVEDLGSGYSAIAMLEMGLSVDDGQLLANGSSGPGFGRQAFVGLGSERSGFLSFGRQYTPIFALSAGALDPFGANYLGSITTSQSNQGGLTSRASNALSYSYGYTMAMDAPTPRDRFSFAAIYALGEAANGSRAGDQAGAAIGYGQNRWFIGYAVHAVRGSAATSAASPRQVSQVLGATYRFDPVMLFASLHRTRNDAPGAARIERANWMAGARIPMPRGQVIVSYQHAGDRTANRQSFRNASVAYEYPFSRRTTGYVNYGRNDNHANAGAGLNLSTLPLAKGSDASAIAVGMRHAF